MQPFTEERSRHSYELRGEGSWGHKPKPLCDSHNHRPDDTDLVQDASPMSTSLVPRPRSQQLRVDYITATWFHVAVM
eukprot:Em0008g393a